MRLLKKVYLTWMILTFAIFISACTSQDEHNPKTVGISSESEKSAFIPEGYNPDRTSINQGGNQNEYDFDNESNQNVNSIQNQKSNQESYPGSDIVNSLPSCTKQEVFSVPPFNQEDYSYIEPLGHLNPSGHHILPSEWLSVNVHRNGYNAIETNVYAPADITIYNIKHFRFYNNSGIFTYEYYDLEFSPCKEIRAWYGDLMPSDNLNKLIASSDCAKGLSPSNSDMCTYPVNISIKAGDILGTAGGSTGAAGMIFGVYDSRVNITEFANPARYRPDHLHTACPMKYFAEPAKSMMYGFFGWNGEKRTVEPICGVIMQDVPGTAQGSWFDGPLGNTNLENEGKAISLIHDNRFGILGELVIGGQVTQAGMVEFTTTHTGTTNREPSEVTADGKIYCYQNYDVEHTYTGLPGKFILQLIDADTLKIEHQDGSCTGRETFVHPYTYKR
jgi:hypothetical protein